MKYITFSRFYPKGHPRHPEETFFVEKILNSLFPDECADLLRSLTPEITAIVNDFFILDGSKRKHTTIRSGNRFKAGDMASLRVWSDKPYRSKQIEFAQVEVKKVWVIRIEFSKDIIWVQINGGMRTYAFQNELAKNDGLELQDFIDWFKGHPKKGSEVFTGQIICWSPHITY